MRLLILRIAAPVAFFSILGIVFGVQARLERMRKATREVRKAEQEMDSLTQQIAKSREWEAQQAEQLKTMRKRIEALDETPLQRKIEKLNGMLGVNAAPEERRAMNQEVVKLAQALAIIRDNKKSMLETLSTMEQSLEAAISVREETERQLADLEKRKQQKRQ